MNPLLAAMLPELILAIVACGLLLLGASPKPASRRAAAVIALGALLVVFIYQISVTVEDTVLTDSAGTFRVFQLAQYIKTLAAGIGMLFVLLAWPSNATATGNAALDFGTECGEFFGLMLLAIAGIFLVAGANDIITLFLGIELASIPTYIMVSISRPISVAQEAGVKYFFLGAMAAAIMLFGFSYLYGTTGLIHLDAIGERFRSQAGNSLGLTHLSSWQLLAVVMLITGFCFKIAAVPMHFYAGDVYQGAATPLTALLSFVPKITGIVAIIKLIYVAGGNSWATPETLTRLLWALAATTMTVGNLLGLIQIGNLKRVLAYSSVAHSGYMLVGLTALAAASTFGRSKSAPGCSVLSRRVWDHECRNVWRARCCCRRGLRKPGRARPSRSPRPLRPRLMRTSLVKVVNIRSSAWPWRYVAFRSSACRLPSVSLASSISSSRHWIPSFMAWSSSQ